VRAVTGINLNEWMRWQITIAVQLELANRPGAFWLRPGSRVYRLNWRGKDPVPLPVTVSQGGERVWVREFLPGFNLGKDEGLPAKQQEGAMLCDLSADEPGQVEMRNVLVAAFDVAPSAAAWNTGLGVIQAAKARERRRRQAMTEKLKAQTTETPDDSGG
jgi:hypothetical protein